jgi:hypothetical protein
MSTVGFDRAALDRIRRESVPLPEAPKPSVLAGIKNRDMDEVAEGAKNLFMDWILEREVFDAAGNRVERGLDRIRESGMDRDVTRALSEGFGLALAGGLSVASNSPVPLAMITPSAAGVIMAGTTAFGVSKMGGRKIAARHVALRDEIMQPSLRRTGPGSSLFDDEMPGDQVFDMGVQMAERFRDAPRGIQALTNEEIAAVLSSLPEFRRYVYGMRDLVGAGMDPNSFSGVQKNLRLLERAEGAGLSQVPFSGRKELERAFLYASGKGVDQAAKVMAARIRNMSMFLTVDAFNPSYYTDFNRILQSVSDQTGLSTLQLSAALAAASSQASPYEEVQRLVKMFKYLKVGDDGLVRSITKEEVLAAGPTHELFSKSAIKKGKEGVDTFSLTAGDALAQVINDPDFLKYKVTGMGSKTMAYGYLRYDPEYAIAYVADTVDGFGQFLFRGMDDGTRLPSGKKPKGPSVDTSSAKSAVQNQLAGRILAEMVGVPPAWMQESLWSYIRIMRDSHLGTRGKKILPAFSGSRGTSEELLLSGISDLDPRVLAAAKESNERFIKDVKAKRNLNWVWDTRRKMAVVRGIDRLIPPDERARFMAVKGANSKNVARLAKYTDPTQQGANQVLQQMMLNAAAEAGQSLRSFFS